MKAMAVAGRSGDGEADAEDCRGVRHGSHSSDRSS